MATIDRQATTLALAHALSAAERGLAVIPLSRTKLPALRSPHRDDPTAPPCHGECGRFGHGVYDASTDPRRIRELFAAAPWATGYGIACGLDPHHLIGVDLDTKSGTDSSAALRELALRHLFTIPGDGRRADPQRRPPRLAERTGRRRRPQLSGPSRPRHRHPRRRRLSRRPRLTTPNTASTARPRAPPTWRPPPARPPFCSLLLPPPRTDPPRPCIGGPTGPGPRPVRPRRPRGPAQHPPLLGRLPRLRERPRPGTHRGPRRRRRPHGPHRTRGPLNDHLGVPHDATPPLEGVLRPGPTAAKNGPQEPRKPRNQGAEHDTHTRAPQEAPTRRPVRPHNRGAQSLSVLDAPASHTAVGVGFEPTVTSLRRRFSRPFP